MKGLGSSHQLLVRGVHPLAEGGQAPHRLEGMHNLDGVHDAHTGHALAVVAAQQQAQLDELLAVHAQLSLYVLRSVLLNILAALKNVPAPCAATSAPERTHLMWLLKKFLHSAWLHQSLMPYT